MMFDLPKRTELNGSVGRAIPKNRFYSNLNLRENQQRMFVDQISSIKWMNKISPETMNLSISEGIQEIEIFEIFLKGNDIQEKLLTLIDTAITHPILYVIRDKSMHKLCIAFKEKNNTGKIVIKAYYSSEWGSDNVKIDFTGLSTGEIYGNIINQVSGNRLIISDKTSLSDCVEKDIERQRALDEIEKLQKKIEKTDQPNKKVELVHQLREIKNEWGME